MTGTVVVSDDTTTAPPTTTGPGTTQTGPGNTIPTTPTRTTQTTPTRTTQTTPSRTTPSTGGSTTGGGGMAGGGSPAGGNSGGTGGGTGAAPSTGGPSNPTATLRTVALNVTRSQHGARVSGTVRLGKARAKLRVELLGSKASLHLKGHGQAVVGTFSKGTASSGTVSFTVKLGAAAKRALSAHHKLALTVRVTAAPLAGGKARTASKAVTLRAA
ncbi:MAG TPA: hypothetical protein VGM91_13145 [Conexibacter sp.]|jgi:hypothetical protein